MSAWEILIQRSTLAIATAWQHLNNQVSGDITVIIGGKRTANISQVLSANINNKARTSRITNKLTADKPLVLSANIRSIREASICH